MIFTGVRKDYARSWTRHHKDAMMRRPSISSEFDQRHNERFIVAPKRCTMKKEFFSRREHAGRVRTTVRNNDASMVLL